jgi:hypothetical protein
MFHQSTGRSQGSSNPYAVISLDDGSNLTGYKCMHSKAISSHGLIGRNGAYRSQKEVAKIQNHQLDILNSQIIKQF